MPSSGSGPRSGSSSSPSSSPSRRDQKLSPASGEPASPAAFACAPSKTSTAASSSPTPIQPATSAGLPRDEAVRARPGADGPSDEKRSGEQPDRYGGKHVTDRRRRDGRARLAMLIARSEGPLG